MDYTNGHYKHKRGTIITTSNGFKYNRYKAKHGMTYLRCVKYLTQKACRGSAKLDSYSDTITPLIAHNHPLSEYRAEVYLLKSKCLIAARNSHDRLSKVFKQVVRDDPAATTLSYKNLESTMYRARREIKPPIPGSSAEFCQIIPSSPFGVHYKGEIHMGNDIGVIFFSDQMTATLSEVEEIYFDGTIHTVPSQFYQLWTVFPRFGRHVLPAIYCLLKGKQEEIYTAVLARIQELLPQLTPNNGMSDWERGARNAVKTFPGIRLRGCHSHYSQSI